uniref:Uncharacterized protein n=1 Tax=Alexandrium catenella TaxID=2925 RepID=A0A7S1S486_ALECA|mmetsp:Transcript_85580/g.227370  ORF Transcript_85580/g.227370 Transcript_85580/m.227370 type:complete len:119 (+) Transcript_85580:315-671(+)
MAYGPLALHILGTLLVLTQPVFDSPGGIVYDIQHGLASGPLKPPVMAKGGFWHHGWFMALCQVSGLACFIGASIWSMRIHEDADDCGGAECPGEEGRPLHEKQAAGDSTVYSTTATAA